MLEKFAADYSRILYARPAKKDVHPDYARGGVADRLGVLLQTLADSPNTTTSGLASHILLAGDHSTLPILADHLDETGDAKDHKIRDIDLRYAPRGIAIDKALSAELSRHRVHHGNDPLSPNWVSADWRDGARTPVSKRAALKSVRTSMSNAHPSEILHSIVRLAQNYRLPAHPSWTSHFKLGEESEGELKPAIHRVYAANLAALGSKVPNAHNYPDPRPSKKSKSPPEQFARRGRKWIAAKIRKLRHEGRPEQQSIAIAENMAGNAKYAADAADAKTVVMNKVRKPIEYNSDDYHNAIIAEPEEPRLAKAYSTWLGVQNKPATKTVIGLHADAHANAAHVLNPSNFVAPSANWRSYIRVHSDGENPVIELAHRSPQKPSKVLRWATPKLTREKAANLLRELHAEHGGEDAVGNGELVMDEAAKKLLGRGTENFAAAEVAKYAIEHTEDEFHRAMHENPESATHILAYADWLREHGRDAHAELLQRYVDEHDKSKSKAHPTMQYSYMPEELTNWEPGTVRVHHIANPSLDHHIIEIRQRSLALPNSTLRHIIFGKNGNITPLYKQLVAEGAEPAHAEPNSYHADFHIPADVAGDVHGDNAAENYAADLYAAWRAPAGDIIEKVGNSGLGVVHKGGTFINNLEKFTAAAGQTTRAKLRKRLQKKFTLKPKTIELPAWTPIG
jgi:uncharacterized protein (TIGR02996 family)